MMMKMVYYKEGRPNTLNDKAKVEIFVTSFDGSHIIVCNNVERETCYDHEAVALHNALENAYEKMSKALTIDEIDYELSEDDDNE